MFALVPFRRYESELGAPFTQDWADRFFDDLAPAFWGGEREGLLPKLDISETAESIIVKADLPGIDVKDLDISVTDNVLTLRGEKKEECEEKAERFHRVERRFGSFCRSFALPGDVKTDGIEATYKDGVLRLTIPKAEGAKPKKIEVQTTH